MRLANLLDTNKKFVSGNSKKVKRNSRYERTLFFLFLPAKIYLLKKVIFRGRSLDKLA